MSHVRNRPHGLTEASGLLGFEVCILGLLSPCFTKWAPLWLSIMPELAVVPRVYCRSQQWRSRVVRRNWAARQRNDLPPLLFLYILVGVSIFEVHRFLALGIFLTLLSASSV